MLLVLLPYAAVTFVIVAGLLALLISSYKGVRPGTALVLIDRHGKGRVLLEGGTMMLPFMGTADPVLVLPREIALPFVGEDALSSGGRRVSFTLRATVRVDATKEAVHSWVEAVGASNANDSARLAALLRSAVQPAFAQAVTGLAADTGSGDVANALRDAAPRSFAGVVVEDLDFADVVFDAA